MTTSQEMVTIGRIDRPFGVRGAVKVRSLSDRPGRFERLQSVRVTAQDGQGVNRTVRHVRRAGPSYILEFADVSTPEEAGTMRGALLQVPQELPTEGGDAWYECDLIGLTVADEDGHELGCVETIWQLPAQSVLVVNQGGREVLIPAVKEFVRAVDIARRRMTVRTIEGLIEA
jgi:16S rRNA processing protein RimM